VLAYYGESEKLFTVPADRFVPAPKVNSSVIRIKLHKQKPHVPKNEAMLFRTIKAAFGQRRKTLVNALGAGFPELSREQLTSAVTSCGHAADIRGEKLDIAQFTALSDVLFDMIGS
jgi:16S rRNA (adenine1518-N6/adenine1519-N6)-dimethyltransferase